MTGGLSTCHVCGLARQVPNQAAARGVPCRSCQSIAYHLLIAKPVGEWVDEAICAQTDPELFFMEWSEGRADRTRAAVTICDGCPVRLKCLEHALEAPEMYGIWGGTTPEQRRMMREGGAA